MHILLHCLYAFNECDKSNTYFYSYVYTATYAVFAIIAYNHSKRTIKTFDINFIEFVLFNL